MKRLLVLPLVFAAMNAAPDSTALTDLAIEAATVVGAPRSSVWQALTDPAELPKWFGRGAKVELREGGPYEIYFLVENPPGLRGGEGNTISSLRPGHLLAFTWNAPPSFGPLRDIRTHVLVELSDDPAGGTRVKLTHYGWREGADWRNVHDYFAAAWPNVLANLKRHFAPAG
jgi:uncharacterized protein YndB with AHSA1/START domain